MKHYLRLLTGLIGLTVLCLTQLGATAQAGFSSATLRVNLGVTAAPPAAPVTVNGSFTYGVTCVGVVLPQFVLTFPPPAFTIAANAVTPIASSATISTGAQVIASNNCTFTQLTRPVAPAGLQWSGSPPDVVITNIVLAGVPPVYTASFANVLVLPTVSGVASPPTGGGVACIGPATAGATATCTQTTNLGYNFTGFSTSGCGAASSSSPSYTTAAISANCTVTGTFALNTYSISTTVNPLGGGSVVCNPNPVPFGSTATCSGNPNPGYVFASLSGCSGATVTPGGFVTAPINATCTVTANFTQQQAILTNVAVPTLNGWMLILLSLMMLGTGGALWWRSR